MAKRAASFAVFLRPQQIEPMQSAAGLAFSPALRATLAVAFTRRAEDEEVSYKTPRPKQVTELIEPVRIQTAKLLAALQPLMGSTPAQQVAANVIRERLPNDLDLPTVLRGIAALHATAIAAVAAIESRGGRPATRAVAFARSLRSVFEAAGGEARVSNDGGKYSGPFADFVTAACKVAGIPESKMRGIVDAALYEKPPSVRRPLKE